MSDQEQVSLGPELQIIINHMHCFIQKYIKANEDRIDLQQQISVLKSDLKYAHEIEKSQCNSINSSKQLITKQQSVISMLTHAKEEIDIYKEQLENKDKQLKEIELEKQSILKSFEEEKDFIAADYQDKFDKIKTEHEEELKQYKSEIEILQCKLECEMRSYQNNIHNVHEEKDEQISSLALEYEEKLQQANSIISQKNYELQSNADKYFANISLYRRRIEALEKLKSNENRPQQNQSFQYESTFESAYDLNSKQTAQNREIFKIANKSTKRPALNVQFINCSTNNSNDAIEPPKSIVKPMKRKLFNKNTEFCE